MASPIVIFGEPCHYCSKHRNPRDLLAFGDVRMCLHCYERHTAALEALATGLPPKECGECQTPFSTLAEWTHGEHVQMFIHHKDGMYQCLCGTCSDAYALKRRDLYGPTEYGRSLGL